MIVYPIDFSIKDNVVRIPAWSEQGRVIVAEPFSNYFYTYPRIPSTHTDIDRIVSVTDEKREYFGDVLEVSRVVVKKHWDTKDLSAQLQQQYKLQLILEADVPVIRKYLYDNQIDPLKGYEISGKPSNISPGCLDFSDRKKLPGLTPTTNGQFILFDQLCVVGFDIETYAESKNFDSKKNPILMIALYVSKNKEIRKVVLTYKNPIKGIRKNAAEAAAVPNTTLPYVETLDDEASMIRRFNELLKELKPDIICGYNSDGFDWPYIADRCEKFGIKLDFGPEGTGLTFGGGTQKSVYLSGSPHIDVCNFVRVNMRTQLKTQSYSLDAVSEELLGEKKIEVSITRLFRAWDEQDRTMLDQFIEYNIHDAYLCVKLLEKLFANILEFVGMIRIPVEDATRMSYSQLVESYLMNRTRDPITSVHNMQMLIPARPSREETDQRLAQPPIEGAFVFKPTPGLYQNIVVCDFRSLYPSIIASQNLERGSINKSKDPADRVPEYDGELYFAKSPKAFIPKVIEDIVLRRDEIKKLIKAAAGVDKQLLEARSYNLKILANSLYGYLAFAPARWYSRDAGQATTAYARHFIKYTIRVAQEAGFNVIYSDTDSLFIELKQHSVEEAKGFVEKLNTTLPGIMRLQFEDEYVSGIFVGAKGGTGGAKKRYALLAASGKFKITGFEYVRGDWCAYARETQYTVISILLKEKNPKKAFAYARERLSDLLARKVALSELVIVDKLSREVSEYETNLPHVIIARRMIEQGEPVGKGKKISYLVVNGKGPIYERVVLPDAATAQNVDVSYYANNQVIPVVDSIFQVFGYKKEDLELQKNQTGLGDFF